jgi:hypothetical protein
MLLFKRLQLDIRTAADKARQSSLQEMFIGIFYWFMLFPSHDVPVVWY